MEAKLHRLIDATKKKKRKVNGVIANMLVCDREELRY